MLLPCQGLFFCPFPCPWPARCLSTSLFSTPFCRSNAVSQGQPSGFCCDAEHEFHSLRSKPWGWMCSSVLGGLSSTTTTKWGDRAGRKCGPLLLESGLTLHPRMDRNYILQASSRLHGILLAQSQSMQSMRLLYLPRDSSGLFYHILPPLNTLHLRF